MLRRYNNGAQVSELMAEFAVSSTTVHNRISAALKLRIAPNADEYREAQNALLDESMTMLGQQLDSVDKLILLGMEKHDVTVIEKAMTQRLKVIEARTRVLERRARLNGLDRPVRAEVTVHQVDQKDMELAELIREAKAKAATG